MDLSTINMIRQILPEDMPFRYYPDRESAWVLANLMQGDTAVPDLRASDAGKLLTRPVLRPLVAGCGGVLRHRDVLALAHADRSAAWALTPAAQAALAPVYAQTWHDFTLSVTDWGSDGYWRFDQVSRPGHSLVVQLGFPTAHAQMFGRYFDGAMRRKLEYDGHPIRQDGPPTLAWARLDLDLETGTGLIEEVQCDWLRFAVREKLRQVRMGAKDRALRTFHAYEQALLTTYAKMWPRAMLLAALYLMREEFGMREVWMHTPHGGAMLKHITHRLPPRSLYTDLPRAFCFEGTRDAPPFLRARRKRHLAHLARQDGPIFWRLAF